VQRASALRAAGPLFSDTAAPANALPCDERVTVFTPTLLCKVSVENVKSSRQFTQFLSSEYFNSVTFGPITTLSGKSSLLGRDATPLGSSSPR
jgi:hypothetical protein